MRSVKSFFNFTLYRKDLTRFWPLPAAYALLWFILVPLQVFGMDNDRRYYLSLGLTGWAGDTALSQVCCYGGVLIAAAYGALCAMAVWSYLFNSRSANMTHTLPLRREGHFAVHFLSGASFFVLPHLAVLLLTALAGAVTGSRGDLGYIAAAMGIQTLLCLFFFCFATLCAFVTGHILALPAFFLIANFLVLGLSYLLGWMADRFLFGFTSSLCDTDPIRWLTPFVMLSGALRFGYAFDLPGDSGFSDNLYHIPFPENTGDAGALVLTREIHGLPTVLIYAALGLALTVPALLLYRRRHLESAGDVIAVPWLRPVFRYGVTLCAALAGTWMLARILRRDSVPLITVLLAVFGAAGYFVARMLLQKTLKVFKSGRRGCAASVAVLLLLCLALELDPFGVERRVPEAGQVTGVYLSFNSTAPIDSGHWSHLSTSDPSLISGVISLHQSIVDRRDEPELFEPGTGSESFSEDRTEQSFHVSYTLADGAVLERDYDGILLNREDLEDPDSLAAAFDSLLNDPATVRALYAPDEVDPGMLSAAELSFMEDAAGNQNNTVRLYTPLDVSSYRFPEASDQTDREGSDESGKPRLPVTQAQMEGLWQAVLADFRDGTLGRRYLFNDSPDRLANTCVSDLVFSGPVSVEFTDGTQGYYYNTFTVTLTPRAAHTLAALEELGVFSTGLHVTSNDRSWRYPE